MFRFNNTDNTNSNVLQNANKMHRKCSSYRLKPLGLHSLQKKLETLIFIYLSQVCQRHDVLLNPVNKGQSNAGTCGSHPLNPWIEVTCLHIGYSIHWQYYAPASKRTRGLWQRFCTSLMLIIYVYINEYITGLLANLWCKMCLLDYMTSRLIHTDTRTDNMDIHCIT